MMNKIKIISLAFLFTLTLTFIPTQYASAHHTWDNGSGRWGHWHPNRYHHGRGGRHRVWAYVYEDRRGRIRYCSDYHWERKRWRYLGQDRVPRRLIEWCGRRYR